MPVSSSDLQLYKSATMAANFTTATIGGAISGTLITGGTIGEVLFTMGSNLPGGGNKVQVEKIFYKNTNTVSLLTQSAIFILNALTTVGTAGTVQLVSSSTSDNSTYYVRINGFSSGTNAQLEQITMNGTTAVNGSATWSSIVRAENRLVSSGVLSAANGNITVTRGTVLGIIPAGWRTAISEITIALAGTLNDNGTTTNASTPPSLTFSNPSSYATGISVANSGTMNPGDAQGVWIQWTLPEQTNPSEDIDCVLVLQGNTV